MVGKLEVNKEVLKGHIDTLILSLLHNRDMYGYELAKLVRQKSDDQFELKEGTLYLSLKRLEKNKWMERCKEVRRQLLDFERTVCTLMENFYSEINYLTSKEISENMFVDDVTDDKDTFCAEKEEQEEQR